MSMPLPEDKEWCFDVESKDDMFERRSVPIVNQVLNQLRIRTSVGASTPSGIVRNAGCADDIQIRSLMIYQSKESVV
jgi:hypothetical protein